MSESSLQDRLRDHAKAFDGLLSLIPAKDYYGQDTSDQWKRKKQTKQEAAAARRAKLDPDSALNRNAKEVMDERAKNKRKLREMEQEYEQEEGEDPGGADADVADADDADEDGAGVDDESFGAVEGIEAEQPGQGLRKKTAESNKKQKFEQKPDATEQPPKLSKKEEKRAAKRERKNERRAEKKARRIEELRTPAAKGSTVNAKDKDDKPTSNKSHKSNKGKGDAATPVEPLPKQDKAEADVLDKDTDDAVALSLDSPGLEKDGDNSDSSASESTPPSPTFDTSEPAASSIKGASGEPASATTSVSSALPAAEKPKHIKMPADTTALRARLAAKIEALRAARKADGPDGKPIRTRQELIEARRAKQAQRKAHKNELRQQTKMEEARKREEALASNSPGVMSPAVELDESTGNFSFGRVVFGDGSQMSHDLSYVLNQGNKKGPSDPKTALLKVQNQKKRLQELGAEKRADIAEKEAWLTARRRIQGEKVRDDEAMLKRAVKRKEAAKKKGEKAWRERATGVEKAQKERQKKREENIKKRKEEKLLGKAGKKKGVAKKKKKGGRPGFEGSLGVGGSRKK